MFFPEAARFLGARHLQPDSASFINAASIDTRTLQPGNLFVALRGNQTDGHQYLETAFKKGASGAILEESFLTQNPQAVQPHWKNLLVVPDAGKAFLKLSAYYRSEIPLKAVIGVAGSVGKTSTKEFLAYLLKRACPSLATEGNLNNHLGLPLTLFRLKLGHQICVCELGANKVGDVRELAEILRPDHGILTRIAPEHLEGFGSMEQVYRAEIELFQSLKPGSLAVMPDDDPVLWKLVQSLPLRFVKVGLSENADYRVTEVKTENGLVSFKVNGHLFAFPGLAGFLARNAAMAIAMAEGCGIPLETMPKCWEDFKLPGGRFQEHRIASGIRVIHDGYNASPASFEAAVETFEEIASSGRKILVFSDMLEMGTMEKEVHQRLGEQIAASSLDGAVAYGPRSRWTADTIRTKNPRFKIDYFENAKEAASFLASQLRQDDTILLKGSRSMKVEDVLNFLSDSQKTLH